MAFTKYLGFPVGGVAACLLMTACGASPAYDDPEIPPPPPHAPMPMTAPPPPPQTVPVAVGDGGVVPNMSSSGPLPDLPSQAPIYAENVPAPPANERVATYPNGQWVYADGDGWMWIPNDTGRVVVEQVPYSYMYTPGWGWNWYVSPWGYGGYRYGGWVSRPYRPVGWRGGWVAPRHVSGRIGGSYRGGGYHGGGGGFHGGGGHHR